MINAKSVIHVLLKMQGYAGLFYFFYVKDFYCFHPS